MKTKSWWADLRDVASAVSPGVGLFMMGYHYWGIQSGLWFMLGWLIGVLIMERSLDHGDDR